MQQNEDKPVEQIITVAVKNQHGGMAVASGLKAGYIESIGGRLHANRNQRQHGILRTTQSNVIKKQV